MSKKQAAHQEESKSLVPLDVGDGSEPCLFTETEAFKVPRQKPLLLMTALSIALGVVFAFGGGYLAMKRFWNRFTDRPQVYFEIKAVESSGHPVVGAQVWVDKERVGVTDSFGEWRRYIQVYRGQSLALQLHKKMNGETLSVFKNIVVPLDSPEEGQVSVVKSLLMGPHKASPTVSNKEPKKPISAPAKEKALVAGQAPKPEIKEDEPSAPKQADTNRMAIMVEPKEFSPTNRLGQARYQYLTSGVFDAIKWKTIKSGIAIDPESTWRVSLRHLSVGSGKSLIQVISHRGDQRTSFLKNYYATPELTAEKIVSQLNQTLQAGYASRSPRKDWVRQRLKVHGGSSLQNADFYFSGYEGRREPSGDVIYWGHPDGKANVTIVQDGQVLLRKSIANLAGRPANLVFPGQTVARR